MNSKENFYKICTNHIDLIRRLQLPNIELNKENEAVLIEFRELPHLEFIIRNSIHKLGTSFSHTIICGKLNYETIANLCKGISDNIKIIKLNVENINVNNYNNLLHSNYFWNLFVGEKILIHQEDSIIFKQNVKDFLEYDYIGAPWKLEPGTVNSPSFGNGGFSLRSKEMMLEIISKRDYLRTFFVDDDVKTHCSGVKLDRIPEDFFFSKSALILQCYKLPSESIASFFSTENILNKDSFGGHQFWNEDKNWTNRMILLMGEIEFLTEDTLANKTS
jgi:hypothetical protein